MCIPNFIQIESARTEKTPNLHRALQVSSQIQTHVTKHVLINAFKLNTTRNMADSTIATTTVLEMKDGMH